MAEDAAEFRRIFDAHLNPLRRFVYSYVQSWETAEEIVHDAFLQYWRRRRTAHAEPIREVKTYLFSTARNLALNWIRHERVEVRHLDDHARRELEVRGPAAEPEGERRVTRAELAAQLQRAIDSLPPRQREVVLLKWERQLTHEKIGQVLGIAEKTVDEHFRRALEHFRAVLPQSLRAP